MAAALRLIARMHTHYCLIYADVHNSDDVILFILLVKASFNKTSWLSMGKVIGVELRSLCTYD